MIVPEWKTVPWEWKIPCRASRAEDRGSPASLEYCCPAKCTRFSSISKNKPGNTADLLHPTHRAIVRATESRNGRVLGSRYGPKIHLFIFFIRSIETEKSKKVKKAHSFQEIIIFHLSKMTRFTWLTSSGCISAMSVSISFAFLALSGFCPLVATVNA